MRDLVSVEHIADLQPIEGADRIELAKIKGWQVVVKKGDFEVGDLCVYFEVDSWIPKELAPFLCSDKPKFYNNIEGSLLKTIRLRGQISQGLLLTLDFINDYLLEHPDKYNLGLTMQERLEVTKFESPETDIGKMFPTFIKKTDQERIQNLDMKDLIGVYETTEKLDGSSMTVFNYNAIDGVCSRNVWLKDDDKSNFTRVANELEIIEKLAAVELNLAIQGELVGPGIQGNLYKLTSHQFYCYAIFDIDKQEYLLPVDRYNLCKDLGIPHVPIYSSYRITPDTKLDELLTYADGKSNLNQIVSREGLVFKDVYDQTSFKVISNNWLVKQK